MAAYKVWREGGETFWATAWQGATIPADARDCTPEEEALMDKVIWDTHTADDIGRLRTLLNS